MVKIRKPKKDNKEVIPVDNPEVIQEGISKAEEFITKNKNLLYLATGIILFYLFHLPPLILFKTVKIARLKKKCFKPYTILSKIVLLRH